MGINSDPLKCSRRSNSVPVEAADSSVAPLMCRVPQGSILGPLLTPGTFCLFDLSSVKIAIYVLLKKMGRGTNLKDLFPFLCGWRKL